MIGEITTDSMIIVLNKIDCIPEEDRAAKLEKVTRRIRKTFACTKFSNAPIITTAAAVGGEKVCVCISVCACMYVCMYDVLAHILSSVSMMQLTAARAICI